MMMTGQVDGSVLSVIRLLRVTQCNVITTGYAFVWKICERASDGEDINIQENMDLGNCVCLDRVGKFSYPEDMLSGGGTATAVMRVCCEWRKL